MNAPNARVAIAALVVAVAALAGCAAPTSTAEPAPRADATLIDELLGRDTTFRDVLQNESIQACMKQNGFDYTPPEPVDEDDSAIPRRSLDYRQQHGFGIAGPVVDSAPRSVSMSEGATSDRVSAQEQAAYNAQEQRCWEAAQDEIRQRINANVETLPDDLVARITSAELAVHSDLRAEVDAWSRCMNELGHRYADSIDLWQDLEQRADAARGDADALDRFRAEEIRVAVDDYHCFDTHVAQAQRDLLRELERELNDSFAGDSIYS